MNEKMVQGSITDAPGVRTSEGKLGKLAIALHGVSLNPSRQGAPIIYLDTYDSPVGMLTLASDGLYLCGLWLEGQKYFEEKLEVRLGVAESGPDPNRLAGETAREEAPGLRRAHAWLDTYFAGGNPGMLPPVALHGTPFQEEVWVQIAAIPYGRTTTYGAIADTLSRKHEGARQSVWQWEGIPYRSSYPAIASWVQAAA